MKFTRRMPLLRTRNLPQTVVFYRDRFDLESTQQTSDWAFVERDGITLMIALPNAHEPFDAPCFTGSSIFQPTMSTNSGAVERLHRDCLSHRRLRLGHAGVRDS